jgi:hypothetical protein
MRMVFFAITIGLPVQVYPPGITELSKSIPAAPEEAENDLQIQEADYSLPSAVYLKRRAMSFYVLILLTQGKEYALLETGFVAGNMLIQASAIDLGCHFKAGLTSSEQAGIQAATNIPSSHVPQAIVSIGPVEFQVSISVALQGDERPDAGWVVPLAVKFFTPGTDVMNDSPIYEFELTTTKSSSTNIAVCEVTGITPGTYDITVFSETTLMNVKRGVVISATNTSVDLGVLLEGDANQDSTINLSDYAILSMCWLASESQAEYDVRADLDRDGLVNTTDLLLLTANWLGISPVEVPPLQ